jgi:hypothetical protein
MVNTYAKVLGLALILVGALGFVPALTPNNMLFGIFMTDTAHNMVHLLSGLVLFSVGFSDDYELIRRIVLLFAVIYGLITLLGFTTPSGGLVLGMPMNLADDILHLGITVTALVFALPQRYPTY